MSRSPATVSICLLVFINCPLAARSQDDNLQKALEITPKQENIDFDTPAGDELANCTIESAKDRFDANGWVVIDGQGRVIRKFLDSNGDKQLDQWSYYKDGIEVYRDIDSDFDRKADQYRWFGTAGTRWGMDKNQDGTIDSWNVISAEEVSAEIIEAIKNRDAQRFARLLISPAEIDRLGVGPQQRKEIHDRVAAASSEFESLIERQTMVSSRSHWIQFGGMRPGIIPAGTDGSTADVTIYDSVAAVVDNGDQMQRQVSIGTLIQVGSAWRAVDVPEPIIEGQAVKNGALFFQASYANPLASTADVETGINPANQQLYEQYDEIENAMLRATGSELPELQAKRANLLTKIIEASSGEDRSNWIRQLADTVSGAYQNGEYDAGVDFLQDYVRTIKKGGFDPVDVGYVQYRRIAAFFAKKLESVDPETIETTQKEYMAQLKDFVASYPSSEHAPEAMFQLGLSAEFAGETAEATKWYGKVTDDFPQAAVAKKAKGAMTRLNSEGHQISLSGRRITGQNFDLADVARRVVLVQYWATWSDMSTSDMATLKRIYDKYKDNGFTIVSINVDDDVSDAQAFLKSNPLPWVQLFEPGGLDGTLAEQLGIVLVPTMMLIGADGKVIDRNIVATDLDRALDNAIKK